MHQQQRAARRVFYGIERRIDRRDDAGDHARRGFRLQSIQRPIRVGNFPDSQVGVQISL
jgi:hypothetical protein